MDPQPQSTESPSPNPSIISESPQELTNPCRDIVVTDPQPIEVDSSFIPSSPNASPPSPQQETSKEDDGKHKEDVARDPSSKGTPEASSKIPKLAESQLQGYALSFSWLSSCSELMEILNKQGWVNLLTKIVSEPLYPSLFQEFSENFENNGGVCKSVVKGVSVEFDEKRLGAWLGVPCTGFGTYNLKKVGMVLEGVSPGTVLVNVGGMMDKANSDHKHLNPLQKMLYNIVWRSLVPRFHKRSTVLILDATLIYCLERFMPINFPKLFIQHLTHCILEKSNLGYGNIMTHILKTCGVKFDGLVGIPLGVNHIGDETSVKKLNLMVKDGELVWCKGPRKRNMEPDDEETVEKGKKKQKKVVTEEGGVEKEEGSESETVVEQQKKVETKRSGIGKKKKKAQEKEQWSSLGTRRSSRLSNVSRVKGKASIDPIQVNIESGTSDSEKEEEVPLIRKRKTQKDHEPTAVPPTPVPKHGLFGGGFSAFSSSGTQVEAILRAIQQEQKANHEALIQLINQRSTELKVQIQDMEQRLMDQISALETEVIEEEPTVPDNHPTVPFPIPEVSAPEIPEPPAT